MKALTITLAILLSSCTISGASAYDEQELDKALNGQLEASPPLQSQPDRSVTQSAPEAAAQPQTSVKQANPDAAPQTVAPHRVSQKPVSVTGIPNFKQVTPTIYRGGQPTVEGLQQLYALGVRTVVNLRNEEILVNKEQQVARSLGMKFINIPLDVFNPPSQQAIQQFLKITDASQSSPVFVHCLHGQDRTGTMVALYRIRREGWKPADAYHEMLACGFRPGFGRLAQVVNPGAPTASALIDALERKLRKNPTSRRNP